MLSTFPTSAKSNVFTAAIVSADPELRREIEHLMRRHPALVLSAVSDSLDDLSALGVDTPLDLLFLDANWGAADLFSRLAEFKGAQRLVLISSDDRDARRAFDVRAFDFLVQPVDPDRFSQMVRVLLGLDWRKPAPTSQSPESFFVPFERGRRMIQASELVAILAYGNYTQVCMHHQKDELVLRSLSSWMQHLPESQFLRVHRNAAVNLKHIRMLAKPDGQDTYQLLLEGRTEPVPVSRRSVAGLKARMTLR